MHNKASKRNMMNMIVYYVYSSSGRADGTVIGRIGVGVPTAIMTKKILIREAKAGCQLHRGRHSAVNRRAPVISLYLRQSLP